MALGARMVRRGIAATLAVATLAGVALAGPTVAGAADGPQFVVPPAGLSPTIGMAYPTAVSGTYVPLAMDCLGEKRVLWYAPGAPSDSLWRNVTFPATGSPAFTNVTVSITGDYQPFTGDFDGDGCEDVFWYAPGAAIDPVWYFAADGSHTSVAESVTGTYQPVVGSFDSTTGDDIFWFGGAALSELIWQGSTARGTFTSSSSPQFARDGQAVLVLNSSILLDAAGTADDVLLERVTAGSTTAGVTTSAPLDLGRTYRNLGGWAVAIGTGAAKDLLVTNVSRIRRICRIGDPCPPTTISLVTSSGVLAGGDVVTNSTARAGFAVLHAPGASADAFLIPNQTGTYARQPDGLAGARPNGVTVPFAISADGNRVLLRSSASNLVAGDTNAQRDVFVWDRVAGTYQRQPNGVGGAQPDNQSVPVAMSADGRHVLLISFATNLVAGDTNAQPDLFVWDRTAGTYQRQPNGVGGAQPNGASIGTGMSADGTKVLLSSTASNLAAGDTNGQTDAFVWDRTAGTYQRQPNGVGGAQPSAGTFAVAMSADTTKVVLTSGASNLVASDTNGLSDVFLWNRTTGTYLRQPSFGSTEPNGASVANAMTPDAGKVLITTLATNLGMSDTNGARDVFLWDTVTGSYLSLRDSVGSGPVAGASFGAGLSADGTKVLFVSAAANVVPMDSNGVSDVFLWDRSARTVVRQPYRVDGRQPVGVSAVGDLGIPPVNGLRPDGHQVILSSADTQLAGGPAGAAGTGDAFVWNRFTG